MCIRDRLYTIWSTGSLKEQVFAVFHCTAGDVLIALAALAVALIVVGSKAWPVESFVPVLSVALIIGVGYTIFSEWLNIVVRASWTYSSLMPIVPVTKVGLSPLLQWIVIPTIAFQAARRVAGGR